MQDEINSKVVALSIRMGAAGARLTAHALKEAMQKYLAENERAKLQKAQKAPADKTHHGKQTVGQLMEQNTGLTNIEVTDQNIKSFERIARKYNLDFALKKDKAASPPRYLVFFKARDVDVMNAAFKEYSAKSLAKSKKPSIRKALAKSQEQARKQQRERVKEKQKDRGQEL